MKQIYTLLAAACISTAAFAGIDRTVRYEATRLNNVDVKELVAKQGVELKTTLPEGMQRIINQSDNTEWATMIAIQGKVTDVYGLTNNNREITFEEFPFYDMVVAMQDMSGTTKGFYPLEVIWPAYGAYDDDIRDEETGAVDVEKCKEKWGEKALQPYSYEDFIKVNKDGVIPTMPGFFQMPSILGPEALAGPGGQFFGMPITNAKGETCYLKSSELVEEGEKIRVDSSGATTLDWRNFDLDSSSVQLYLDGKFSSEIGGVETSTTVADLVGEAVILGFKDILWDTIGEVHIFNAGPQDKDGDWTWNYENAADMQGTLNFYYLAMCDETMSYNVQTEAGEKLWNYEEDDLPKNENGNSTTYGAPGFQVEQEAHFIYLAGALWAPENSQPYGKWEMKTPVIEERQYVQCPEAFNLVVYTGTACGQQDGLHGAYEGYMQPGVPERCFLGIGDKNNGLNFLFGSAMNYGYYIYGTYKGDIYFHNTPNKWRSEITKLPAVSDLDADYVGPFVGVESVVEESNAPVVSRSFYNFQGQRLSSEPESGLYIIRSVKADGTVKAEKVAK